jgi:hypothetical protein
MVVIKQEGEQHMDLQVGSMELVAPLQMDKIVGIGEGTVEGTADTDWTVWWWLWNRFARWSSGRAWWYGGFAKWTSGGLATWTSTFGWI